MRPRANGGPLLERCGACLDRVCAPTSLFVPRVFGIGVRAVEAQEELVREVGSRGGATHERGSREPSRWGLTDHPGWPRDRSGTTVA